MGAAMRKGLRVYDNEGFWSRPFTGILCGACVAKARKFHSAKNRWLLQRIAEQTNNLQGYSIRFIPKLPAVEGELVARRQTVRDVTFPRVN
jgi:hypothetical protein